MAAVGWTFVGPAAAMAPPEALGQKTEEQSKQLKELSAEDVDRLINQLGSPDFRTREKATEQLTADDRISLSALETALRRNDLSMESRTRLLQVARAKFSRTPRAAMGVQFGGNLRDRVVVGKTFERFESHRLLQEGDMIVGAGGYRLEGPSGRALLQSLIVSRDPGDVLQVVVRRGAEKLTIDIPLGKFNDLDNNFLPEDRIVRAWRLRSAGLQPQVDEPVRVKVDASAWTIDPDRLKRQELAQMRQAQEPLPVVAGGGIGRGVIDLGDGQAVRQQVVVFNGRNQIINVPVQVQVFEGDMDMLLPPMSPADELAQLASSRLKLAAEMRALPDPTKLMPSDPTLTIVIERQKQLDLLDRQRKAIEAEVAEGAGGKQSAAETPN